MKRSVLIVLLATSAMLPAATIPLNSTMEGSGYISENLITGGFSRINLGLGSLGSAGANTGDRDGHYLLGAGPNYDPATDPNPAPVGSGWDLFPREANFSIGILQYNEAGFTGNGVETFPITGLDLGAFWTSDPNRTNSSTGTTPTVVSDISDYAIGLWLFHGPGGISFGALDAADTVTFVNGVLTSINLQITTTFSASAFGTPVAWDGTFSIAGAKLSYDINDTEDTFLGGTNLVANLQGTVNAVPEPGSLGLLAFAGLMLAARRTARGLAGALIPNPFCRHIPNG